MSYNKNLFDIAWSPLKQEKFKKNVLSWLITSYLNILINYFIKHINNKMPIVQTYPDDFGDNAKEEYLKRQLLEKIASAKFEVRWIILWSKF